MVRLGGGGPVACFKLFWSRGLKPGKTKIIARWNYKYNITRCQGCGDGSNGHSEKTV